MDKLITRKGTLADTETIVQFQKNMAVETEGKTLQEFAIKSGVTEVIKDTQKGTYLVAEYEAPVSYTHLTLPTPPYE